MKLGSNEIDLLFDIFDAGLLVGFLMSGRSTKRMYEIANRYDSAKERATVKRRYKRALKTLEEKGLVKFSAKTPVATDRGKIEFLKQKTLLSAKRKKPAWDGKWRIVMFDFPEAHTPSRHELRRLLLSLGFEQIQLSVYVYPYQTKEAFEFIAKHPIFRQHSHVFEGSYFGDDRGLRKIFGLGAYN